MKKMEQPERGHETSSKDGFFIGQNKSSLHTVSSEVRVSPSLTVADR